MSTAVTAEHDVFNADGSWSPDKAAHLAETARQWPPEQRAAVLTWMKAARTRATIRIKYRNAAEVAASVDPTFVRTPALNLIADNIETVLNKPQRNLIITMPPQEGKSSISAVWTPIRALQLDPNRRIILASYGDDLARAHSMRCRGIIDTHGSDVVDPVSGMPVTDRIGLKLARNANRINAWKIENGEGGMYAVGVGGPITGKAADLFIIDDPFKNMMEADSAAHRHKINEWMSNVVLTRLSPGAGIILIQTRWHPEDLAGTVIAGETVLERSERSWRHINIPAISEVGIPDALGREPGIPMVSCRDTPTAKRDFVKIKRRVGERTWYALYQGNPRNPKGGLFLKAWFDDARLDATPVMPVASIVGIDPADSGEGDETGIIGGCLAQDGTIALVEDWSGQMTSDQWSRQAVLMALQLGAREIAMESYTTATTYAQVIKRAWKQIHEEALAKHASGALLTPVENRALTPDMPFVIHKWRERGDAVVRSALLRQACEIRRCRTVEAKLAVFEAQAADWQAGQHCPDRVAAAVITHHRLHRLAGGTLNLAAPVSERPLDAPDWLRRKIG